MTNNLPQRPSLTQQSRVSDQPAFILRRRDWRDSSLLLDLFTPDYGCIRVMARAARRNPAKAPYQPFELLTVGWSGRAELKTLTAIEAIALPVDEANYLALLYINELIGAMLPEREANPEIFTAYLALLQQAQEKIGEAELRQFELELMQILGYFPDISVDATNGLPIEAGYYYQFVIDNGFVTCSKSTRDSIRGEVIIDWLHRRYEGDTVLRLAKAVLRSSIDLNLHGKTLKSREVLLEMKRRK